MNGPTALVRRPSPRLAEGLITHISRQPVDTELAFAQWANYCTALAGAGWTLIEVPPAPDLPDSGFVEDTVVMYGDLAVLASPGAPERVDEVAGTARVLRDLGYRIAQIQTPGTLDGGDVLKHGTDVWVGLGGRTNPMGVAQLRSALRPEGARVIGVPLSKVLHLKSAVTALPDGTVIGYPPLVDDTSIWSDFLAVSEEPGAHVVVLDDDSVLMAASAPESAAAFQARGLRVITVDISEFEKLEGCVTCLSVRLRHSPGHSPGHSPTAAP
ncbi:MAG: dimethylargininase [Nocardioides sp.]